MKYVDSYSRNNGISVMTKQKAQQDFNDITATYDASGMILALIFGIIGLLNLLNVIMTGAIARQNEFAVMRSIGMTRKQLRKLFIFEGVSYMVLVMICGTLVSGLLSVTAIKSIAASFWFSQYHLQFCRLWRFQYYLFSLQRLWLTSLTEFIIRGISSIICEK